jgi:hypothetical protein
MRGRQHEFGHWCTCTATTGEACQKCREKGIVWFMGKYRTRRQVVDKMLTFKCWKGAEVEVVPPRPAEATDPLKKLFPWRPGYYIMRLGTAEMRIQIPPGDPAFAAIAAEKAA